jgi:hypothetical protein
MPANTSITVVATPNIAALSDAPIGTPVGTPAIGTSAASTPVVGTQVVGTQVAGTPVVGTSVLGTSVLGTPVAGTSVAGTSVAGTPVTGTPVLGTPVLGTPVVGTSVAGTPVETLETRQLRFIAAIRRGEFLVVRDMLSHGIAVANIGALLIALDAGAAHFETLKTILSALSSSQMPQADRDQTLAVVLQYRQFSAADWLIAQGVAKLDGDTIKAAIGLDDPDVLEWLKRHRVQFASREWATYASTHALPRAAAWFAAQNVSVASAAAAL